MLIWLKIIKERYPEHSNAIDTFVLRWNFCQVLDDEGTIYGTSRDGESANIVVLQEGRFGYEEYAAKGFDLWGFDNTEAAKAEPYDSEYVPQFSAVSLKGALGLWAVWKTDYTGLLFSKFARVYDPEKGFYEGVYENGSGAIDKFTANNNGIILEALLYKVQGKLLRFSGRSSLWDKTVADTLKTKAQCLPGKS